MNYYESIYSNIEDTIKMISENSIIPPELLFALCCNESGKWLAKNELIPSRAEPYVLNALRTVQKGDKDNYKGITINQLINKSPDELLALSTSYGVTQIMGWWSLFIPFEIGKIHTVPMYALKTTIEILILPQNKQPQGNVSALEYINNLDYESIFRIWNTGLPDGKTYDKDYVKNGFKAVILWLKYNLTKPIEEEHIL